MGLLSNIIKAVSIASLYAIFHISLHVLLPGVSFVVIAVTVCIVESIVETASCIMKDREEKKKV